MNKDEMRTIRRELINLFIHESALCEWLPTQWTTHKLAWCKEYVREYEANHYGYELKVYAS